MTMSFPAGETVAIVRPGTPGFGGDPGTPEPDREVPGCVVYPGSSMEQTDNRDTVTADYVVLMPAGADIKPTDQVRCRGELYDVDGQPGDYISPFDGWDPGIEVRLRRSTG